MSKNQINYLLALATLLIVWLFFNTFYAGAISCKLGSTGARPSEPMRIPRSPRALPKIPAAMPRMNPVPRVTPQVPSEIQKVTDLAQVKSGLQKVPAPAPSPSASQEKN